MKRDTRGSTPQRLRAWRKYSAGPRGRARARRYRMTLARRLALDRYNRSPKGREAKARYSRSLLGRLRDERYRKGKRA